MVYILENKNSSIYYNGIYSGKEIGANMAHIMKNLKIE